MKSESKRIEISQAEFLNLISKESEKAIVISNRLIRDSILVKYDFPKNGLILENCEFNDAFILEDINLNIGIKILDCFFHKELSFNCCKANSYDSEFNSVNGHVQIFNSSIKGLFFNGNNTIERGVKICNKTHICILQVVGLKSESGSFIIEDSEIEKNFFVRNSFFSNGISLIENSKIKSKIRCENIKSSSITFQKSTFEGDVWLWSGTKVSLCFQDSEFYKDVTIQAVPISSLTIVGSDFKESFKIENKDTANNAKGSLEKLYISSSKFINKFLLEGNDIVISKFEIPFSKKMEGGCYLKSCIVLETLISGDNHYGNLVFNRCELQKLKIYDFINYSNLSLISVKEYGSNSLFSISNTNLGKTQLFNTNLDGFKEIIISNSILLELITANVTWFEDKKLFTGNNNEREFTQIREVYRQLKYSSEKEGNKISSLRFKAFEMKAYRKELNSEYSLFRRFIKNDTYLMWAAMTNNNGQSWFKPVLLAILFGAIIHFFIIVGVSDKLEYSLHLTCYSWSVTYSEYCEYFKTLPQVMNPTHILSKVFGVDKVFSTPVYFLDYLLRIVITFFVFQVITAFRRYMK